MKNAKNTPQATLPKRISPELAEVLHMLKSLESQPAQVQSTPTAR